MIVPVQYVNRRGDTYYVLVGKTKTGKPKYYTSKKPGQNSIETMPAGYEIHEDPADAQVRVRKTRPSRLLSGEREQVVQAVRELAHQQRFIVDVDGDSFIVYLSDADTDLAASQFGDSFNALLTGFRSLQAQIEQHSRYTALLRLTLVDPDRRLFVAERWCFLGSIDNWFPLSSGQKLGQLLDEYTPHLGQDSFYELI